MCPSCSLWWPPPTPQTTAKPPRSARARRSTACTSGEHPLCGGNCFTSGGALHACLGTFVWLDQWALAVPTLRLGRLRAGCWLKAQSSGLRDRTVATAASTDACMLSMSGEAARGLCEQPQATPATFPSLSSRARRDLTMPHQPVIPSKLLPIKTFGTAAGTDLVCQVACSLLHHDLWLCCVGRVREARRRTSRQLPSCYIRLVARSGSPPSSCLPHRRYAGQSAMLGSLPGLSFDLVLDCAQLSCCTFRDRADDT